MCLAIPARISDLCPDDSQQATVDILGVRRKVNIALLDDDPPRLGDWVLVHVGFAMSKISHDQATEQLELLMQLGAASEARDEVADSLGEGA